MDVSIISTYLEEIYYKLPKSSGDVVDYVNTKYLPYAFALVHYTLVALSLRQRTGARNYAKSHPFASWFVCVVSSMAGSLVQAILLNNVSITDVFVSNKANILYITVVWYLMMFSPRDFFFDLINFKGAKGVLLVLKEVHRVRNVQNGVETVISHYSTHSLDTVFFVAVMIGSVRGSAAKFVLRPLDSFVQGNIGADNEFLKPTFTTKHAVVTAILLLAQKMGYFYMDEAVLVTVLFLIAGAVQLVILFTNFEDPYKMVEELLHAILFEFPEQATQKAKKNKKD